MSRRGRPRKHLNGAARARAYRRRKKLRSILTTRKKAIAAWNRLSAAQQMYVMECVSLTQQLQTARTAQDWERVEQLTEMLEYTEQIERQRVREEKIAASGKLDTMSRGLYLHDAPSGMGLLIFLIDPAFYHDQKIANDDGCGGGRRVQPTGHAPIS